MTAHSHLAEIYQGHYWHLLSMFRQDSSAALYESCSALYESYYDIQSAAHAVGQDPGIFHGYYRNSPYLGIIPNHHVLLSFLNLESCHLLACEASAV